MTGGGSGNPDGMFTDLIFNLGQSGFIEKLGEFADHCFIYVELSHQYSFLSETSLEIASSANKYP
jgi:hypothetical protein